MGIEIERAMIVECPKCGVQNHVRLRPSRMHKYTYMEKCINCGKNLSPSNKIIIGMPAGIGVEMIL